MLARTALDNYLDRKAVGYIEQAIAYFTRLVLSIHLLNFCWDCGLTGRKRRVKCWKIFRLFKLNQMD